MQDFATPLDGVTFINPLGLVFTLLMGLLLVVLPRKYSLVPVIALMCYMTMGMRFVVGGLNFTMLRVLLLFGWARLVFRGELRPLKLNPIDKAQLLYVLVSFLAYCLLWQNYDAFKNRMGFAYNTLGFYFLFRFLIREYEDVVRVLKMIALLIVPLAVMMVLEGSSGRNAFALFGGVPDLTFIRDGRLRCEGPFAHPILAGTFGATLLPLSAALWTQGGKNRIFAILGLLSCVTIVITSASSGPLLAMIISIVGLMFWALRRYTRHARWAIVLMLVSLHMVMKAPVWFLLARVDVVSGSTGFHRAYLIDRAVANLGDWWLVGTKSTAAWAFQDAHLFDVTNQYILVGADGGLLAMLFFILVIVRGFQGVGRTVRSGMSQQLGVDQKVVWALGAALLAHTVSYISVSYFDQNFVNWNLLLAMIGAPIGALQASSKPTVEAAERIENSTELRLDGVTI